MVRRACALPDARCLADFSGVPGGEISAAGGSLPRMVRSERRRAGKLPQGDGETDRKDPPEVLPEQPAGDPDTGPHGLAIAADAACTRPRRKRMPNVAARRRRPRTSRPAMRPRPAV